MEKRYFLGTVFLLVLCIGVMLFQQSVIFSKNNTIEKLTKTNIEINNENLLLNRKLKEEKEKYGLLKESIKIQKIENNIENRICIQKCKGTFMPICVFECNKKSIKTLNRESDKKIAELKKYLSSSDYQKLLNAEKNWNAYYKLEEEICKNSIENKQGLIHLEVSSNILHYIAINRAMALSSILHYTKQP